MTKLVFIIGAARSGTKILRDILSTHPNVDKVPYDINFIWRISNEKINHDKLNIKDYNAKSHTRIEKYLNNYLTHPNNILIEKTVSNTIRIPYLLKHFPKAKFIFLYRNGIDVCESVLRQWNSKPEKNYLIKKMGHIPLDILFNYGLKTFFRNYNHKRYYWGVKYPGMEVDLNFQDLEYIVSKQWSFCIKEMIKNKEVIKENNLIEIYYEDMVLKKEETFNKIINFLDPEFKLNEINLKLIRSDNIGKFKNTLDPKIIEKINKEISKEMSLLNY